MASLGCCIIFFRCSFFVRVYVKTFASGFKKGFVLILFKDLFTSISIFLLISIVFILHIKTGEANVSTTNSIKYLANQFSGQHSSLTAAFALTTPYYTNSVKTAPSRQN